MKRFFLAALFLFTGIFALAQETTVIPTLDTSTRVPKADRAVLKQYQAELQKNTQAINISRPYTLNFYEYTPTRDFSDLYALSSRISLRYDTIVSLNAIDSPQTDLTGKKLYIPTADGLFIAKKPVTSIDYILQSEYPVYQGEEGKYPTYTIGGNEYYFIVDAKFSPTDRAYYTQKGLVLPIDESILDEETKSTTSTTQVSSQNPAKPLDKSVVTSPFGMRISPISGKWLMHKGVDLAAPTGTPIKACKSGTVTYAVAMNPTYGNYVVLDHGNGMTSLYGHMSQILVKKGQKVATNQVIGKVGSTGLATGPHLHFEIKLNGEPQDPLKYIDK
ncbi:MAG: M23 family metallopeptidase [Treponema sp.]|nr:M23 family metallopeptidase [Treponema sp.]